MNREILFRGKRVDNGEWVEGSLLKSWTGTKDMYAINKWPYDYNIDYATVGQYTELADKNGKKIFEGDILRLWKGQGDNGQLRRPQVLPVEYSDLWCQFVAVDNPNKMQYGIWQEFAACEVIGNKYDNPELLEVEG